MSGVVGVPLPAMRLGDPRLTRMLSAALFVSLFMLLACGGGGKTSASGPLSGNWQIALNQTEPPPGGPDVKTESGFLMQSGNSLAGGVLLSGATLCPGLGTASGTAIGSNVAITVDQIAQTVTLTGSVTSDGTSMAGVYSILASGCGASTSGTFAATPVKPISGSFQATFTSGEFIGTVYSFAGTLTQGPNLGMSSATLSGTMTSTNAPCIQNFSIAGQVSGTSVVFNFLASDGSSQGQYRGTTTTDGTTLTGTYIFLAQSNGCYGDAGTVTMAFQPSST